MSAIGRASASASGRTADSPRVTLDTRLTLDEVSRRMPLLPPMQGTELAPSGRTLLSPSLAAAIRLACLISLCAFCSGYCSGYIHHTHHHHAPDAPTAPPVPPSPPPSAPSSGLEPLPDWFFEAWGPVAATGALSCAWSLSALGRRTALLLAASFFALSAALRAIFDLPGAGEDTPETERLAGTWGLAAGYSLQWLAQGMSSAIVPLYVAEISPVTHRGALVGLGVFFLWAGAAVSYVAWIFLDGGCVAPPCDDALPYGRSLRCAGLLIPAALLAFGLCRGHDTPRSALRLGRLTEARESLRSLRGGKHADLAGIEAELDFMLSVGDSSGGSGSGNTETDGTGRGVGRGGGAKGCWALCRSGRALLLGIGLQVVTPLSFGIYMLVLEQDHERREAQHDHFHTSGIVSAISCLAALLVVLVVDRVGRRRLLAISCLTMAASALGIAGCWTNGDTVWQSEGMRWALFFVYAASTFAGVIFVPQLTLVEIYSSEASASGVSISMCCFWLALTAVLTFSPLLDVWQHAYISAGQVVLLLLMTTAVPETARRPLDSHLYGWITATSRPS
jgi:MFS family permease